MKKYRVKEEYIDCIYGNMVTQEYIEECQKNGLSLADINDLLQEYGPGIWDQLEEI